MNYLKENFSTILSLLIPVGVAVLILFNAYFKGFG